jgi:adenine-specific DNA-methyltransferase
LVAAPPRCATCFCLDEAEIDPELIKAYRGTVSLPFEPGKYRRIAVKIVDDRGIESLKVVEVA